MTTGHSRIISDFVYKVMIFVSILLSILCIQTTANAQIQVFAGDDFSICNGNNLDISMLNASITGDASDGNWFTSGDGIFLPSGISVGSYSSTTEYVPGSQDQADGTFDLLLVSDDPDGIGPMIQVSDQVTITFQNAPPLACNSNINVSLNLQCQQEITVDMLISNPVSPTNRYIIYAYDENGILITDNILTADHIGQDITYTVGHDCTLVTCEGSLTVTDNFSPVFACSDSQIVCSEGSSVEEIGLPIPSDASAVAIGNNTYTVSGWDACGNVSLSYNETESIGLCNTPLDKIITRTWIATDASGNSSYCTQSILIERQTVDDVTFPPNYNDNDQMSLSCDEGFETNDEGFPSPNVTGTPMPNSCHYLEYTYTDTQVALCGGGYKVLRTWLAIDWCLAESAEANQIIKVVDTQAPTFSCVQDVTISTSTYDCESNITQLNIPTNIVDCSGFMISATVTGLSDFISYPVTTNQGNLYIDKLPQGTYNVDYTVTDDCSNASTCTSMITVVDNIEPYTICDEFTTASITSNGEVRIYASTFDDGSFDNCGIVELKVAKMTDQCGFGLAFGDYVMFCCDEVNDTVMVALRVTDANGNSNTCEVLTIIEDNIAPELTTPSNLTISCDTDYDLEDLSAFGMIKSSEAEVEDIILYDAFNNGIVGVDGYYNDNCTAQVSESATASIDCFEGVINRTFTVTDAFGMTVTGYQTISIQNPNPIEESDIIWPANISTIGCQSIETNPALSGQPILSNVSCGIIAFDYDDEIFPMADTACVTIIRHWTAIDWCQYDSDTGEGYWTNNQIIKLSNYTAPQILNCIDTIVCSYDDNCINAQYNFDLRAKDDCTDSLLLQYTWAVDIDNDGSNNIFGTVASISTSLPHGEHKIYWTVSDACGNTSECDYIISVKDCKAPTPSCYSSVTTVLMPSTGQVSIWADDFDLNSYDNCTAVSDLQFSFSENVNDKSWTIDCEDIENGVVQWLPLRMYVTDVSGNQDYCEVQIIIQDHDNTCEDLAADGILKGNVRTDIGDRISGVEIEYKDTKDITKDTVMTNAAGKYISKPTYDNVPYYITPRKTDEVTNGVSTLDIVLIQRHILGFTEFTDPLQILAADVNGTNSVSGADVVIIRKIVLGVYNEFPNAILPWKFIPQDWVFTDITSPWNHKTDIYIEPLVDTMLNVNFTAIKLGDVNHSYEAFDQDHTVESRSVDSYSLQGAYTIHDDILSVEITAKDDINIDAVQFGLDFDARALEPIAVRDFKGNILADEMYRISHGQLYIAEGYVKSLDLTVEETLFTIDFHVIESNSDYIFSLNSEFDNIIYESQWPYTLTLEPIQNTVLSIHDNTQDTAAYHLLSNPSAQCILLTDEPLSTTISISAIDAHGRVVYQNDMTDESMLEIPQGSFTTTGIYYITIYSDRGVQVLKYIHLE